MTASPSLTTGHAARRGAVIASLRAASKTFGSGDSAIRAVDGVDIAVCSGELLAVLGPNGAGKSTVVSLLTGLARPTSGTAELFGGDPRRVPARQRVGAMLQISGVPETLRVGELLRQFRGYYPDPLPMGAIIDAAGLGGLERRLFGDLSGGQQRRVLFGLALCGDPELLFFDEPTTGLDVTVRRSLWATLRDLTGSGRGVVLTTHYLEEADALADRIVVIDHGRVIAEGTPSQIKALVPGRRIRARTAVTAEHARGWPGVTTAAQQGSWLELLVVDAEPVLRELLAADQGLAQLTVTEPSLEEAFLTLTHSPQEAAA
jgi:ABC-2 type transport system ATP-binding protein